MTDFKAICIKMKCENCGKEHAQLIPMIISEENWLKTKKMQEEISII